MRVRVHGSVTCSWLKRFWAQTQEGTLQMHEQQAGVRGGVQGPTHESQLQE